MACNCQNITRVYIGSIATDTGNTFLIATPNRTTVADNKEKLSFIFTVGCPAGGEALPVFAVINGANVPIYDKYGNKLLGVSIKTRRNIHAYYGSNGATGAHVQFTNFPCEG